MTSTGSKPCARAQKAANAESFPPEKRTAARITIISPPSILKIMIKAVIFDLDGTLYIGHEAVKGAAEKLAELREKGMQVLFFTNAGTRSRENRAKRIVELGLPAKKEEVYCSSYLIASYIKQNHSGKKVFVVGEQGIIDELEEAGIEHVEENADIVVAGLDREFTYEKLAKALKELNNGAVLIASNKDNVFPTEEGYLPGAGSVVAAVEKAAGREALTVGKPSAYALELIKKDWNLKNEEIIIVGDRLDTDIRFAKEAGIKSVLVLSGVSKKSDIKETVPDYVFQSVAELSLP